MFETFRAFDQSVSGARIHGVIGGSGPPLLLLHGYPQTHVMWHKVAPALAEQFTVVATDLRGYGESSKPESTADHLPYSKRMMARDQVEVMQALGFPLFAVAGHDRGGRVTHRMALDYPDAVSRACVMDIGPTYTMFQQVDREFATVYFHWFFLVQPFDVPERMIGADPDYWLEGRNPAWVRNTTAFTPEARAEYRRCFRDPACIHATCEDYRAAITIDLQHDEADLDRNVTCPLLVLWGAQSFVGHKYNPIALWQERADNVRGHPVPSNHFLAEEAPAETLQALLAFFSAG